MELCLMIEGQEGVSWEQWRALAQACERHGIPALFRSDHYLNLDGQHPERGSLDAWATINALAAVTTTLRLGTMVSPATFRHPSELAKLVATADRISDGRIDLGLGAGWHEREHAAYGFPFASTKVRMDVLEEQLQIVLGNWSSDGPYSFSGEHYRLEDLDARPKPVQQPHPPVIIGGAGGARSARFAAAYGDEYNTPFPTIAQVRERRGIVERACEQAGRDLPFSVMTGVVVGENEAELAGRLARLGERIGSDGDTLRRQPPAGWVVGTLEHAAEQLAALRDAGVHRVMCQHLLHDDLDAVALIGERLAPLVA